MKVYTVFASISGYMSSRFSKILNVILLDYILYGFLDASITLNILQHEKADLNSNFCHGSTFNLVATAHWMQKKSVKMYLRRLTKKRSCKVTHSFLWITILSAGL
jgi:hypothetical protein